jgi:predicted SAM-dependent methyltransferase
VNTGTYVQYGCGPFCAPEGWINFDASPTLRIQRLPGVGPWLKKRMHVSFAPEIRYGDILEGLSTIPKASCKGVYCSHVLEHLCLEDCRKAIQNTYALLQTGGRFRCVVPDLEWAARNYIAGLDREDPEANIHFLSYTMLGARSRPRDLKSVAMKTFGHQQHLYMWDKLSLKNLLLQAGFSQVRSCTYHDSIDPMFVAVEEASRFEHAVAMEAVR